MNIREGTTTRNAHVTGVAIQRQLFLGCYVSIGWERRFMALQDLPGFVKLCDKAYLLLVLG